jgi:hypothetical protein
MGQCWLLSLVVKGQLSGSQLRRQQGPDHLRCRLAPLPGVHRGQVALQHLLTASKEG